MLKITPKTTFKTRAALTVPGTDKPAFIGLEFKHLSRPEIKDYFDNLAGKTDAEALAEVIVGWEDVDAPYSADNLKELLDNYPTAAGELFETFRKELLESKRKN